MNLDKLKELCELFTVTVAVNGFLIHSHKVIDANKLLERIHEVSDLSKDDFVTSINKGEFISKEIEAIFMNIKSQGTFKLAGHDALGNHSYIECSRLKWL